MTGWRRVGRLLRDMFGAFIMGYGTLVRAVLQELEWQGFSALRGPWVEVARGWEHALGPRTDQLSNPWGPWGSASLLILAVHLTIIPSRLVNLGGMPNNC